MKTSTAPSPRRGLSLTLGLLVASLIANAALVTSLRRTPALPKESTSTGNRKSLPAPERFPAPVVVPELWSQLASESPTDLTDRLRAAGFEETFVRAIVWAQLTKRTESDPANKAVQDAPYWRKRAVLIQFVRRHMKKRNSGEVSNHSAEFEALFGEKPSSLFSPNGSDVLQARRGLDSQTSSLVTELRRARQAQVGPDRSNRYVNGKPDEAIQQRMERQALANTQFESNLRAQLSPAEYETYLHRASETANFLQSRTGALGLTQTEYDGIVKTLGPTTNGRFDPTTHEAALTAFLGEERYAEFAQATTGDIQTNRVVERLGLPISTAIALQGIQDDITQRAQTINHNRDLSREEKTAQTAALGEEANQRIAATLPAEGVVLYNNHAGRWMRRFTPSPPPSPPPGP